MRLSYSLQKGEYVAALQAVVESISATDMHRKWTRRLRRVPSLYLTALFVAAVLGIASEPGSARGIVVLLLAFFLLLIPIYWYIKTTEAAQLGATFEPRRHHDMTAIFDSEGATQLAPEHEQTWKWTLLQRFHELPEVYVLEFAGFDMLVVPRRAFTSRDEADSWAGEVRGRLS